jgi:hypothetical protein
LTEFTRFPFPDVNTAYQQSARNVLIENEALLQRFKLTITTKPQGAKQDKGWYAWNKNSHNLECKILGSETRVVLTSLVVFKRND